jgi:galactonate dehydratase
MAETYDVAVAPHCPLGPIALAACLQIGISTPNHQIQEMSVGMHYNVEGKEPNLETYQRSLANELCSPSTAGEYDINSYVTNPEAFAVKNGFVEALQGPGLGIEINEEVVRKVAQTTKPWDLKGFVGEDGGYREW